MKRIKLFLMAAALCLATGAAGAGEMRGLWECAATDDAPAVRWEFLPGGACLRLRHTPELGPDAWMYAKDQECGYEMGNGALKMRWKNSAGNPGEAEYRLEGAAGAAPVLRQVPQQSQEEIARLMTGKWRMSRMDNRELPTDHISCVLTFVGKDTVMVSSSTMIMFSMAGLPVWTMRRKLPHRLEENRVRWEEPGSTFMIIVHHIDENKMRYGLLVSKDKAPFRPVGMVECQRVNVDYAQDVIGLWEGVSSSGYLLNGDHNFRMEFRADGKYRYWERTPKGFELTSEEMNEYGVDGDLLMTRWFENGTTERREWWLLAINGDTLRFSARRRRFDGQMADAEIVMRRVKQ